jgi:hypothetical protein
VLDIAKEKGIEDVYAIMLPDNYRALNLMKKMGFRLEYLSDGNAKGVLDLKNEDMNVQCQTTPLISEKIAIQGQQVAEVSDKSKGSIQDQSDASSA